MAEVLTSDQMRAVERSAFAAGTTTGAALMERAGQAVVDAIIAQWPTMADAPQSAVVLCGPGNNGGDGFVVARLLYRRGWAIRVAMFGAADRLPPDARLNHDRWLAFGPAGTLAGTSVGDADIVIDALFGIGMTRPLEPVAELDAVRRACGRTGFPALVAVDVPSGLNADTGAVMTPGFVAQLTVTFHRAKLGHFLGQGPEVCGRLVVADIGLAAVPGDAVRLVQAPDPARLGKSAGSGGGHKFSHGHALVLSGGVGRGGAARLAAAAALRIGAGLVTVGCPPAALIENAARLDAVMLRKVADAAGLALLLEDARISAWCLGPGLGLARARGLVPVALAAGRRCVLDADALSAFSDAPDALLADLHPGCVLTPHDGEFARVFPDIAARLRSDSGFSRVDAARAAAGRAGCVVLLKGADTVIAEPGGGCAIHSAAYDRAAPWLATAGSGDVLAGLIVGLLARGLPPFESATTAAWLHVECARAFGPGLIAEDIAGQLPGVLRQLGV